MNLRSISLSIIIASFVTFYFHLHLRLKVKGEEDLEAVQGEVVQGAVDPPIQNHLTLPLKVSHQKVLALRKLLQLQPELILEERS